jgi:site-specific DNA-methyltransferase (adenine-specific)
MTDITNLLGKIHNCDCLEFMKQLPDKCVELVLTDPPYGMNYYSNRRKDGNPFGEIKGDDKYPAHLIPEFKRISRKAVLSFCRWDNLHEVDKPKSFIVWAKNNHSSGDLYHEYGRAWEGCLFYPLENHSFKTRQADIINLSRIVSTDMVHPTQKPVPLCEMLIDNNTIGGDIVFDPFMGSGTTAVACERLGRKWFGCELEPKYCEIANKRIEAERAQLKLF